MKSMLAVAVFTAAVACLTSLCPGQDRHSSGEQRSFGAEDQGFRRPLSVPLTILDILTTQDEVKVALDIKNVPSRELPPSWFLASEVHLAGPNERDIVVMGRCPVCGASVVPFWVFRPHKHGYQLIMAGGGLGLDITHHRTNGYLDIQTGLVAQQKLSTSVWRFDGTEYNLVRDHAGNREDHR
jgi:hypothetical protein